MLARGKWTEAIITYKEGCGAVTGFLYYMQDLPQTTLILAYKSNMFLLSFSSILFLSGLITKIFKNGRVFCKKLEM